MKKTLCILSILLVIMFCSVALAEYEYVKIPYRSNLQKEMSMIELCIDTDRNMAYMHAQDAARISGYTLANVFGHMIHFSRGEENSTISGLVMSDGTYWLPVEFGMAALDTQVMQVGNTLIFESRGQTIDRMFESADRCMDICRAMMGEESKAEDMAGIVASIYNRAVNFELLGTLLGTYDREIYQKLYSNMLNITNDKDLTQRLMDSGKEIGRYSFMKELDPELWGDFFTIYGIATNPAGSLVKEITGTPAGGIDVFSQYKLYSYLESLYMMPELSQNMILYTYSDSALSGKGYSQYLPNKAKYVVDNMIRSFSSTDGNQASINIILEEIEMIGLKTSEKEIERQIEIWTKDESKKMQIAAKATDAVLKAVFPKMETNMGFAEEWYYLSNIQKYLPALYNQYRKSDSTAINAKYTALLTLRLLQVAYQKSIDAKVIDRAEFNLEEQFDSLFVELASFSDEILTSHKIKNRNLDYDKLLGIMDEEKTTDLEQIHNRMTHYSADMMREWDYTQEKVNEASNLDGVSLGQMGSTTLDWADEKSTRSFILSHFDYAYYGCDLDETIALHQVVTHLDEIENLKMAGSSLRKFNREGQEYLEEVWSELYHIKGAFHDGKSFDLVLLMEGSSEGENYEDSRFINVPGTIQPDTNQYVIDNSGVLGSVEMEFEESDFFRIYPGYIPFEGDAYAASSYMDGWKMGTYIFSAGGRIFHVMKNTPLYKEATTDSGIINVLRENAEIYASGTYDVMKEDGKIETWVLVWEMEENRFGWIRDWYIKEYN